MQYATMHPAAGERGQNNEVDAAPSVEQIPLAALAGPSVKRVTCG